MGAPELLSTFPRWLGANQDRFALVVFYEPREDRLHLSFPILREAVSGYAHSEENGWAEIIVGVEYKGEFWDIIFNPELEAEHDERGWFCMLCVEHGAPHQFFATIEELWIEHLLNPFLDWVNNKLAKAEGLAICRHRGATWAALVGDGFPQQEHVIELLLTTE